MADRWQCPLFVRSCLGMHSHLRNQADHSATWKRRCPDLPRRISVSAASHCEGPTLGYIGSWETSTVLTGIGKWPHATTYEQRHTVILARVGAGIGNIGPLGTSSYQHHQRRLLPVLNYRHTRPKWDVERVAKLRTLMLSS